jgi:hypothetical protein
VIALETTPLGASELGVISDVASALVGWRVLSAIPVRRGGNNRVFQLRGKSERATLKIYPKQAEDPRDRLGHEFAALTFLARAGVADVPQPLGCDRSLSFAVYEWIEGTPPVCIGSAEIHELADFFLSLQELRRRPDSDDLPEGITSALVPANVAAQLVERLDRLRAMVLGRSEVARFVDGELSPEVDRAVRSLRSSCEAAGLDFSRRLPRALRVLSPSDFGFHNALRRPSGRLAFLDFEYFGWDEPSKAVADVMLHAGMSLPDDLGRYYRSRVMDTLVCSDPGFRERFEIFFPAMRIIWCLILLNEFLPERWARRQLAGVTEDRAVVEARQLKKAREMLARDFN